MIKFCGCGGKLSFGSYLSASIVRFFSLGLYHRGPFGFGSISKPAMSPAETSLDAKLSQSQENTRVAVVVFCKYAVSIW